MTIPHRGQHVGWNRRQWRRSIKFTALVGISVAAMSLAVGPATAQSKVPAAGPATSAVDDPVAVSPDGNGDPIPGAGVPDATKVPLARPAIGPVTDPRITGPIKVTATSYPFGAADHTGIPEDLSTIGYVEKEYFVSGLANVYTWPADVPTSTWHGSSTGPSFCVIAGHEVPFSKGLLQQIYPSHQYYVRAVAKDTAALVKAGFITSYDGKMLIKQAQQADVP